MAAVALPYENTGTATVAAGSADVVGQGTRWMQCRPGDIFFGRAGERNIVLNIADDTHLSLLFPATIAQAAQGVAVMRTPDDVYTQTLARQVFQKITDSTLVALSGLPPTARKGIRFDANAIAETFDLTDKAKTFLGTSPADNVMSMLGAADYGAIRALLSVAPKQSATNDAAPGAGMVVGAFGLGGSDYFQPGGINLNNLDRTQFLNANDSYPTNWDSTLGTYPMGIHIQRSAIVQSQFAIGYQGHAAFRSRNDATTWQPWRKLFDSRNILGTVSDSGGSPSGALFESGSNANGSYRRYADGFQMCEHSLAISDVATANGAIFGSPSYTWTQPAAFSQPPSAQGEDISSENIWVAARGGLATTVVFKAWCFTGITSVRTIRLRSWGRWK